jgi:hypothetical protein
MHTDQTRHINRDDEKFGNVGGGASSLFVKLFSEPKERSKKDSQLGNRDCESEDESDLMPANYYIHLEKNLQK